jgi:hypothetical protein
VRKINVAILLIIFFSGNNRNVIFGSLAHPRFFKERRGGPIFRGRGGGWGEG